MEKRDNIQLVADKLELFARYIKPNCLTRSVSGGAEYQHVRNAPLKTYKEIVLIEGSLMRIGWGNREGLGECMMVGGVRVRCGRVAGGSGKVQEPVHFYSLTNTSALTPLPLPRLLLLLLTPSPVDIPTLRAIGCAVLETEYSLMLQKAGSKEKVINTTVVQTASNSNKLSVSVAKLAKKKKVQDPAISGFCKRLELA
jgi:hypothetical protein